MFKAGDVVMAVDIDDIIKNNNLTLGKKYTILEVNDCGEVRLRNDKGEEYLYYPWRFKLVKGSVMKDVLSDVSTFMKAHRGVIYTVVLVLVLDQLVFKGAFRERIKTLVSGLLDKAEASVKKV